MTLSLRKSIVVDLGGFYAEVGLREDDIAELLRAHGLQVVRELEDGRYEVAAPKGAKAEDIAAEVAGEKFVEKAEPFPSRRRWYAAGLEAIERLLRSIR